MGQFLRKWNLSEGEGNNAFASFRGLGLRPQAREQMIEPFLLRLPGRLLPLGMGIVSFPLRWTGSPTTLIAEAPWLFNPSVPALLKPVR
jgi:hypothetical protein